MDFSTLTSLKSDELTTALSLDFDALDNEALAAALTERKAHTATLFALTDPSIAQVNVAEALVASLGAIEAETAERDAAVKDAADRFAAAKAVFSDEGAGDEGDVDPDEDPDEDPEADSVDDGAAAVAEGEAATDAVTTASARNSQKVKPSAAKKVAGRVKRPNVPTSRPVTITAAADVEGFSGGQTLSDMGQVAKALMSRTKGFPKYSPSAAKAAYEASGGQPVTHRAGVASFGLSTPASLTASGTPGAEYEAMQTAIKEHGKALRASMDKGGVLTSSALTASGWCAPSTIAYSYLADYVIDGLASVPEVSAPRGGLMLTTGPVKSSQGTALDDFGWTQTEAQADARTEKTFETIVCPTFVDHRLDAVGYGYKIPLLTQKAYPELVTDTLKFAEVLYAHRMNRRRINDMLALSTTITFNGYGPSMTDTIEMAALVAVKERRSWNLGENAIIEFKTPVWVKEVFRADMSRRAAVAFESVTDSDITKHFTDRNIAIEFLADWAELDDANTVLPGTFPFMMYPAGTFITANEDVVNLSAIYDAASLTVNEYVGVFFEQGYLLTKAGYRAVKGVIPVNTAGEMGALTLFGSGDNSAGGSF